MKRFLSCSAVALGLLLAWPVVATAQQFGVGERVVIGSTGDTGTILQIGQTTPEGGVMVKVLLDRPAGPTVADREVWYNSRSSHVTVAPKSAPASPQQAAPAPAAPAPNARFEFKAGDRVNIGSLGVNGTVAQVLGVLGNGAQMLRVEIDKTAPKYPGVSNIYDTISSKITLLPSN
jgi:hypothetical protein